MDISIQIKINDDKILQLLKKWSQKCNLELDVSKNKLKSEILPEPTKVDELSKVDPNAEEVIYPTPKKIVKKRKNSKINQVKALLDESYSIDEIAQKLNLTTSTVSTYKCKLNTNKDKKPTKIKKKVPPKEKKTLQKKPIQAKKEVNCEEKPIEIIKYHPIAPRQTTIEEIASFIEEDKLDIKNQNIIYILMDNFKLNKNSAYSYLAQLREADRIKKEMESKDKKIVRIDKSELPFEILKSTTQ